MPSRGKLGGASGLGRQQAWSPEPSRTPILRSCHVGQVTFDTQQGCSLVLVTTWFSRYKWVSHAQPWGAAWRGCSGVGCHFLLQGIFLTLVLNLCLLHWQVGSLPLSHVGSLLISVISVQ